MPQIRVQIRERQRLLLLVLSGFFLSLLFVGRMEDDISETVRKKGTEVWDQFVEETGKEATSAEATRERVIMWSRLWIPVAGILASFVAWGVWLLYWFWIALGFSAGVLLWLVVGVAGWRGPFAFWTLMFPHYLCYVPALLLLYIACLRWNEFFRERHLSLRHMIGSSQFRFFLLRIGLGLAVYGVGIWMEVHLNSWILKKLYKIVRNL